MIYLKFDRGLNNIIKSEVYVIIHYVGFALYYVVRLLKLNYFEILFFLGKKKINLRIKEKN